MMQGSLLTFANIATVLVVELVFLKIYTEFRELKTFYCKMLPLGWNFLAVQWLGLHASTAEGMGSIPGQGTKIPHAVRYGLRKKKNVTIRKNWVKGT